MDSVTSSIRETRDVLIHIWSEVLDLPPAKISCKDNFFQLGGDSLLLTMVLNRVNERYALKLTLADLLSATDIRQLASLIRNRRPAATAVRFPVRPNTDTPVPATPGQKGLWFLNELLGGRETVYNAPAALRIDGPLDSSALTLAISTIIRRHESLRMAFRRGTGDSQLYITVSDVPEYHLPVIQVSEEQLPAYMTACRQQCFDLASVPLYRTSLLRVTRQYHVFLWNVHHIISDGWSARIFFQDLRCLYSAFINNSRNPLPRLPADYRDYARWLQFERESREHEARLKYWRGRLHGIPRLLELPLDRTRPPVRSFSGNSIAFTIPSLMLDRLELLAMNERASLFTVLLAGFKLLLWWYSGQDDIVVGTPVANRNRPEFERIIGLFANILVLRDNVHGPATFREFLFQVKQTFLDAYGNREIAFEDLISRLNPSRSQGCTPIIQVMFIFQNAFDQNVDLPGLHVSWLEQVDTTAKFDLTMEVRKTPAGLACRVEYSIDLYDVATIERFIRNYVSLLHDIVEDPGQRLSCVHLFTSGRN